MTNQQWGPPPPPPPSPSHRAADRGARRSGPWLAGFSILTALCVASAGTSAYVFLTAGDARAAGGDPKVTATPAAGAAPVTGWGAPIDKAKTKPARTPQSKSVGNTSDERIAANTHRLGDAVMFNNQTAIRIDALKPATIWPGSQAEITLSKWRKKIRIFAVHYTYTNFSSAPVGVRSLSSLAMKPDPFAPDLKWPTGTAFPEVTYSSVAVLPDGIAANYWPRREPPERNETSGDTAPGPGQSVPGGHIVAPGKSVKGVFVTLDVRPKGSKIRIEAGNFRQEGQAWFLVTTP